MPYIEEFLNLSKPVAILEVGCGDGGNLLPFAVAGHKVTGVDISGNRIQGAISFFGHEGRKAGFIRADILQLDSFEKCFDLVICHDVIEHIDDKHGMLSKMKSLLKPGGLLFVGFPAWQMPFGGHQQICRNGLLSKLPFFHLLPECVYKRVLAAGGESRECIDELMAIRHAGISIERFEKIIASTALVTMDRRLYFINPHYEAKFGMKPRLLAKPLSKIRYIRNFFTTSCFYLLRDAD